MGDKAAPKKFDIEQVKQIAKKAVEAIADKSYSQKDVSVWSSKIVEDTLKGLTAVDKSNFKYIVNATVLQKTGAGMHQASSCFWDNELDGACSYKFENKSMYVLVSIYCVGAVQA